MAPRSRRKSRMLPVSYFFWSYSTPWAFADSDPAMLAHDVLDDLLLPGNVCLAALGADEAQADLIEIPTTPFQYFHQALADQRRDRNAAGLLPSGKGERGLPRI